MHAVGGVLPYGKTTPLHRRRPGRVVLFAAVIALAVGTGYWWFPNLRDHIQLLHLQRQCLIYSPAPSTVVHEFPAGRNSARPFMTLVPRQWTNYYRIVSPPGLRSEGTVFLHEMRRRDGTRRLVAVDLVGSPTVRPRGETDFFELSWRILAPGSLLSRPRLLKSGGTRVRVDSGRRAVRFVTGGVDADDASHFTFACEVEGESLVFDGWLIEDELLIGRRGE